MADCTTEQVWQELEKNLFAVIGMVTANNEARTAGIVYIVRDHTLYIGTGKDSWKARHIAQNPHVSLTVTIPKRIPLIPWIKIPAATITFSGVGTVHTLDGVETEIAQSLFRGMQIDSEFVASSCIIKVEPVRDFVTYGVGVPLLTMRNPEKAALAYPYPLFDRQNEPQSNARRKQPMEQKYVHGYTAREYERLVDQATTLTELLHWDTRYAAGCSVLEAGCGVGAQTVALAKNSPDAHFTSVDISQASLQTAIARVKKEGYENVAFQQGDIFNLPFADDSFDHVFVCFVLEHLSDPATALLRLKAKVRVGGTITVIEGDHGSAYFHPNSRDAMQTIACLIEIQARMGGNSLIGRQLFPLITGVGFKNTKISPRMVYVDASRPEYVEGFTKNTFTAMVEGVREQAIALGLLDEAAWDRGIRDLYRTTQADGTFCYTFFKGVAIK